MRCCGGMETMYSPNSGVRMFQPVRIWRSSEWDLYWIRTAIRRRPEFKQLLRVKSMMRYFPPNGTAGFARWSVRGCRRSPLPPARTMVKILAIDELIVTGRGANRKDAE